MKAEIIIVDDDEIMLRLHEKVVEMNVNSPVRLFNNGKDALRHVSNKTKKYLLFLDLNMPGMDGWEFLEKAEALNLTKNLLVVIVSSSIDMSDKMTAKKYACVVDYIEKPLNRSKLDHLFKNSKTQDVLQELNVRRTNS